MLTQAVALGLTLVVEAPLVLVATTRIARGWPWRAAAALLPSCLTHPLAWCATGNFGAHDYLGGLLLVELIVIGVEALLLCGLAALQLRAALPLSIAANTASALLGWVLL